MTIPKPVRLLILLLLVAATAVLWRWHTHRGPAAGGGITLHGNVDIREAQLAFKVSERIDRMLVEEGQRVSAGQLLATLQTDKLRQAVAGARARVAEQRERLAALKAGSRPEEIRRARAELAAAAATAQNAARNAKRLSDLLARKLAAQEQVDNAQAAAETAAAQERVARESLGLAVAGPRKEDIAAAEAGLAAAQAAQVQAELDLADARLLAPEAGVIRDRLLEPGEMASPQKPVYTLSLDNPLWVRAYLAEPQLGRVRPGMAATVTTDSFPGKSYRGWVGFISPTAEFTPKSVQTEEVRTRLVYQVRVMVCSPAGELRLGMPAEVHIEPGQPATGVKPCSGE